MNKSRIERALRKEGFEQIRFFNPDGALGFRPDDSYFSGKEVSLARLKNWEIQELSTLDVAPAVKQACEVSFDRVQMIQDDKNRWALYIKPENENGYSVYPDKEDVNRFFSTLKQAMNNIDKVRMELAHKYYALAETKPDLKVVQLRGEGHRHEPDPARQCVQDEAGRHPVRGDHRRTETGTEKRHATAMAADVACRGQGRVQTEPGRLALFRCDAARTEGGQCRGNGDISRKAAGTE